MLVVMVVCGLDECGRGSLAGPLVAAAVVLDKKIDGLNDSKKLSASFRKTMYGRLVNTGSIILVAGISVPEINAKGVGWANKEIFRTLIEEIEADLFVVDGRLRIYQTSKDEKVRSVVKADTVIPEVMAASVVAKVTRDDMMNKLAKKYPAYGWDTNVGYGTKYHIQAIAKYGWVKHHRTVFVRTALGGYFSGLGLPDGWLGIS